MVFIESAVFARQVQELLADDEYSDLQWHLALHPKAGASFKTLAACAKCVGPAVAAVSEVACE